VKSKVKIMLIFFDIKRIVHKELVMEGQTVNFAYSFDISWLLRENVLSARTYASTELAVASRQSTVSHFYSNQFLPKRI
jgi:hypothetical protein